MLQELCEATYNDLLYDELGGATAGWTGVFSTTYAVPMEDHRCRTQGGGNWGLGILARGASFSSPNGMIIGQNPTGTEVRRLLCANTTIASIGFRVCSSHLTRLATSAERSANRSQFLNLRDEINSRAYAGQALVLGADLNRNSRDCSNTEDLWLLDDVYRGTFGGASFNSRCAVNGQGPYYEADNTGTDAEYNEGTLENPLGLDPKVDYFFMNYQRFYGAYGADATSSIYSDHDPLRTSFTVNG